MCVAIDFYGFEITAILSWYRHVKKTTGTASGENLQSLIEDAIVNRLKCHENETVVFSEAELEIMCAWINRVIDSKYGTYESLYGYERRAYIKTNGVQWSRGAVKRWLIAYGKAVPYPYQKKLLKNHQKPLFRS